LFSVVPIVAVFGLLFALTTVIERKGLGRIQNRLGPNRVGPFGFLQFAADGIKTLIKEDIVPYSADKVVHFLAPIALVIPVLMAYSVLPMGRGMTATNMDAGLLFFFAVGSGTELAVFMAGWSSRNKYSLFGAMRGIAQMISYEIPLILSTLGVVMVVGSLSLDRIVEAQAGFTGWIPHWHVFTPWGFAGFVLFLIAATAESNRSPFDLPEAESEIIAGYFVEYSGFKFALFFLGEYLGLFAISGVSITLFLGGWQAPLPFLKFVPSYLWFFSKLGALICLFIWVRGTVPRFRMDQLMNFAWKFMLPMALVNILAVGLWKYLPDRFSRWTICAGLIAGAFIMLGNSLGGSAQSTRRHYRFAD
jgi:NADH-quinone oxidoreductase subunit H